MWTCPNCKKSLKNQLKNMLNFGGEAIISLCSVRTAGLKSLVMGHYS